jgi:hypothetical protein
MADEASQGQSARDRRRERAKAAGGAGAGSAVKRFRVHIAIVLIFGAIVAVMAVNASEPAECPGHWHSTMDVYVDGARISFAHPKFTLEASGASGGSMTPAAHMHRSDDFMTHMEGRCVAFDEFVGYLDMDLSAERLVLDGAHEALGQAGTYSAGGNQTLQAMHRLEDGEWQPIGIGRLLDRQLVPNERVLVVYGNSSADLAPFQIAADQHTIQSSSARNSSLFPAVGVGLIGLVILLAWHSMSKKYG